MSHEEYLKKVSELKAEFETKKKSLNAIQYGNNFLAVAKEKNIRIWLNDYPHLFRKLQWFEKCSPEEIIHINQCRSQLKKYEIGGYVPNQPQSAYCVGEKVI